MRCTDERETCNLGSGNFSAQAGKGVEKIKTRPKKAVDSLRVGDPFSKTYIYMHYTKFTLSCRNFFSFGKGIKPKVHFKCEKGNGQYTIYFFHKYDKDWSWAQLKEVG